MKCRLAIPLLFALSVRVWGASVFREEFSGGSSSWTGLTAGGASWSFSGGRAILSIPSSTPLPPTGIGTLVATNGASGGAFTGDYRAAGISLIGIRIRGLASTNTVILRWYDKTNVFTHPFFIGVTGVWYTFTASIEGLQAGGWLGASEAAFASGLTNVQRLDFRIDQIAPAADQYEIESVFLDGLHAAQTMDRSTGPLVITWSPVQTDTTYALQTALSVTDQWTTVQTFTPTGRSHSVTITDATNAPLQVYRLQ